MRSLQLFQEQPKYCVLLVSDSGTTGINLSVAHVVIFLASIEH
jgi:SNF2 family DNA or RNA helicase